MALLTFCWGRGRETEEKRKKKGERKNRSSGIIQGRTDWRYQKVFWCVRERERKREGEREREKEREIGNMCFSLSCYFVWTRYYPRVDRG